MFITTTSYPASLTLSLTGHLWEHGGLRKETTAIQTQETATMTFVVLFAWDPQRCAAVVPGSDQQVWQSLDCLEEFKCNK